MWNISLRNGFIGPLFEELFEFLSTTCSPLAVVAGVVCAPNKRISGGEGGVKVKGMGET
jgi:hypothetical protein